MLNVHVVREYGKSTLEHIVQKTSRNRIILNSFLVCILRKNKYHQTLYRRPVSMAKSYVEDDSWVIF